MLWRAAAPACRFATVRDCATRFALRMTAPRAACRVGCCRSRPTGDAPAPCARSAGRSAKELARRLFHRFVRLLLRLPGGGQASRLLRAVAPGPVGFLALRYRAYELRAMPEPLAAFIETETELFIEAEVAVIAEAEEPARAAAPLFDMSDEEARLDRQFAAHGLAATRCRKGPTRAGLEQPADGLKPACVSSSICKARRAAAMRAASAAIRVNSRWPWHARREATRSSSPSAALCPTRRRS